MQQYTKSKEAKYKWESFKKQVQKEIRSAYQNYLEEIINPCHDKNNKILWSMIRAIRRYSSGVSPLKENSKLLTETSEKANA